MATIRLGKINASELTSAVLADKTFQAALREALSVAKVRIGKATVASFKRTTAGRGLRTGVFDGKPELDIKAHLGFDDTRAKKAYDAIEEVLQKALEIAPLRKDRNAIRIRVSYTNLEDYILENSTDVTYPNDGASGGQIEWLQWLLKGGGTVGFAIAFGDEMGGSRSGRAVMVKSKDAEDWDIADYGNFADGDNFVVDIFTDERWQEDVQDILDKSVVRALRNI